MECMQREFVETLETLLLTNQIKTDREDLVVWGTDWTRNFPIAPSAVVFPKSLDDVVNIVKVAIDTRTKLVPSGGRTGLSGGAVASAGEVVVSFDRMNQIVEFNPIDRVVTCEAGVVTSELQDFAQSKNLFYPVDFSSSGSSQIGGNVATNAGGIRVIRYGLTRQWVAGLTVVTGLGEVLRLNEGLVKNATGYDLRHLFIGSEGTLGFITEVEIRLIPEPESQKVMVLGIESSTAILNVLERFQKNLTLSAFEFFSDLAVQKVLEHRELARPFKQPTPFYALVEYDESEDEKAMAAFGDVLEEGWVTDGVVSQTLTQAAALWQLREGISESIAPYTPYKNDISVMVAEIPGFLKDVDEIVKVNYPDFEVCWFGHIGDGNLHLNILRPNDLSIESFYEKCHVISEKIFKLIQLRRGSISAEHGVGLLKRDFLQYSRSEAEIDMMRQLKSTFDPHGIMNPGKLLKVV